MTEDTVITRRKKSGFPNRCLFDDSQVVHSFSKISRALADSKNYPIGLKIDERSLANVSFQLQTFMELTLGKSAAKVSKTITKIPLGAFRDFSVDGSLMSMLSVALKHQMKAGWKIFDLSIPERFSSGVKIIHDAEALLVENRMLRRPQVYVGKVPEHAIPNLISIVQQHGGMIVDNVVEASHVVDWDEEVDTLPSELTEEFVRTLEVRPSEDSGKSLVHWYYHPDSYDEWIPSDHVDGSDPPDTVPQSSEINLDRQWHVCCRFVMDCEAFNEWGNEIDYESIPEGEGDDDETNDESVERSPVKTGAGRKARGRRRLDAIKAKKVPILESITITEKMMQDAPPPLYDPGLDSVTVVDVQVGNECELTLVKHGNLGLKSSKSESVLTEIAMTLESNTQEASAAAAAAACPLGAGIVTNTKRKADGFDEVQGPISTTEVPKLIPIPVKQKKDRSLSRKVSLQSQLKLPSWYNSELLNALEIRHLPDFFATEADRAKNSVEYFRIRNFIVNLYAHNPSIYLSATDCRRKLSGDVCAVLQIHAFLDAFGVINFNCKAEFRPTLAPASLSHWHEDLVKITAPDILSSSVRNIPIGSSDSVREEYDVEWSESMDLSLRRLAVKHKGDWIAVASALTIEYNDCIDDEDTRWTPTAEECLSHFVSLNIKIPSLKGNLSEGTAKLALTSVAAGPVIQQMRYLSSQLLCIGLATVGRKATQESIAAAITHIHKDPGTAMDSPSQHEKSVSAGRNSKGGASEIDSYSCDYISHRLDSIEEKIKLVADVDKMMEMEKERIDIDRRDVQLQRAQICFQPTTLMR